MTEQRDFGFEIKLRDSVEHLTPQELIDRMQDVDLLQADCEKLAKLLNEELMRRHNKKPKLSVEDIKTHWKKQGGKLRGYTLDFAKRYSYQGMIEVRVTGPKGKLQQDAYDKIEQMFSKCSLAGGAGYLGVGGWRQLRPNIYVHVPLDAELIDLVVVTRKTGDAP